ncbi:MAG: gliding motility-associated C-terminal domain-containing protein, partial [Bacteroidetes bacterium]|nr:gliding motility-associated C-terminal domain-containing protein [Bacteroidota bacterium]
GSYTISLTVTSSLGSCTSSITNTNMINVYPNPVANFTAPSNTSIINPTVSFIDNSSVPTGAIASWHWNFGDPFADADSTSGLQNPFHTFTDAGTYCATLSIISDHGCVDTTQLCVIIDPEFTFFIPNAFSPNGDGINDEFYGKGEYINSFEMLIYDRWGNLIFFSDDINKHWDGKANHGSELAQQDVYVYVVKIKDIKDKKHKYTGTVTIVK